MRDQSAHCQLGLLGEGAYGAGAFCQIGQLPRLPWVLEIAYRFRMTERTEDDFSAAKIIALLEVFRRVHARLVTEGYLIEDGRVQVPPHATLDPRDYGTR
jgi:hypothetical protein